MFSVSVHDVAPATWPRCETLMSLLDRYKIPATLLIVPEYHGTCRADRDPNFVQAIQRRVANGDEVALHGYSHVDTGPDSWLPTMLIKRRLYTAREGEFSNLSEARALDLIHRGLAILNRMDLSPTGFIAPAWLLSKGALRAAHRSSLTYTCTRDRLMILKNRDAFIGANNKYNKEMTLHAPSLVYSTRRAWRRTLSLCWNNARLVRLQHSPRIRLALHPNDALHSTVMAHWQQIIETLLTMRHPCLETDWLKSLNRKDALDAH